MPSCSPSALFQELLPYQRKWVSDTARWKFGLMARQVGKDYAAAFEGIADCARAARLGRKMDWLIVAPSERQSLEALAKWKEWAGLFRLAIDRETEEREGGGESLLKAAGIFFPGGSRVLAMPSKPETIRGYSANILVTEFAFFDQAEAVWKAVFGSVSNTRRGLKKVRLLTTPNGIGNKAHELWTENFRGENSISNLKFEISNAGASAPAWSCHWVDIHAAVKQGLEVDVEELKAAFGDGEGWAQEFECQFLDQQATLLTYEMIAACESPEATALAPARFWEGPGAGLLYTGVDFGRQRHLTVAWTIQQVGDVFRTVEVLEMAGVPTPEQVAQLRLRVRRARRACLDYTGAGVGLGDYLAREFKEYHPERHKFGKIELCHFTNALKVDIFSKLRMNFERRNLRVPVSRAIREDLHSLRRVSTATGQISYRAPHSADGHADRCTALALALRAAGDGPPPRLSIQSVPRPPSPNDMGVARARAEQWTL